MENPNLSFLEDRLNNCVHIKDYIKNIDSYNNNLLLVSNFHDYTFYSYKDIINIGGFGELISYINKLYVQQKDVEKFNENYNYYKVFGGDFCRIDYYEQRAVATNYKNNNIDISYCYYPLSFIKRLDLRSQLYALTNRLSDRHKVYYNTYCKEHGIFEMRVRDAETWYRKGYCPECYSDLLRKISNIESDINVLRGVSYKGHRYSFRQHSDLENSIKELISKFYKGPCMVCNRSVIGKEIDLYYPDVGIGVEVNGDYYHKTSSTSSRSKPKEYHMNKFLLCKSKGVLLVSIFESFFYKNEKDIILYLKDLFKGKENKLSYIDEHTLNLDYPTPFVRDMEIKESDIKERFYPFKNDLVYNVGTISI